MRFKIRLILVMMAVVAASKTHYAGVILTDSSLQVGARLQTLSDHYETGTLNGVALSVVQESIRGRVASTGSATQIENGTIAFGGSATFQGDWIKNASSSGQSQGYFSPLGRIVQTFTTDSATKFFLDFVNTSFVNTGLPFPFDKWNDVSYSISAGYLNTVASGRLGYNTNGSISADIPTAGTYTLTIDAANMDNISFDGYSSQSGSSMTAFSWGISEMPGAIPQFPIMPSRSQPEFFEFDVLTPQRRFYDPVFASGYDFVADGTGRFASVMVPNPLAGGQDQFDLLVGGNAYSLLSGQSFDLTTFGDGGVNAFGIRGIHESEQLDPKNPSAFVTGLTFSETSVGQSFRMTPVVGNSGPDGTVTPEPTSLALALAGFAGLGMAVGAWRRRRTSKQSAA